MRNLLAIGLLIALMPTNQADALPGQDIQAIVKWSQNSTIIAPLQFVPSKMESNYPDYKSERTLPNDEEIRYQVYIGKDKKSRVEYLTLVTSLNALRFNRKDFNGLNFIRNTYDESVELDFRSSVPVVAVRERDFPNDHMYVLYLGKRYSYEASFTDVGDATHHTLCLRTLSEGKKTLAFYQKSRDYIVVPNWKQLKL